MSASVTFDVIGRDRGGSSTLRSVGNEAEHTSTMLGRFGRTAAAVFTGTALYNGARDLMRLGEGIGQLGSGYVTTLNQVQAISRSSSSQISANASALESQASQYAKMGQTASDAAEGELELTKAGLSLKSAYAAVLPTMTLAKSGQLAVGDAATLVSNTLNAYHLKAKQAVDITNEIANAADISSADVTDLAESFKYVSPLAAKSGVDLAQTNAVLAELANSGVKASQAGTSFRKFLLSIQAPSKAGADALKEMGVQIYDADGKMRPLVDIIGQFQQSLGNLTQEQQNKDLKAIFGLTGLTGATILIKGGTQALDRYSKGVDQAGGAARLANANSKGLAGTLSMLKSEAETGAEAFYRKYSPAVNDFLNNAIGKAKTELPVFVSDTKAVFGQLEPTFESLGRLAITLGGDFKDLATSGGGSELVSVLKTINTTAKGASDFLNGLPEPVRKIGIEVGIAALVLPTFAGGVTSVTSSVRTNIAALAQWRTDMAAVRPEIEALYADLGMTSARGEATSTAMAKLGGAARAAAGVGGMVALMDGAHRSNAALSTLETTAGAAALGFSVGGPWGAAIGGSAALVYELGTKFGTTRTDAEKAYAAISKTDALKQADAALAGLKTSLDQVTGAYTQNTRSAVDNQLRQDGLIAAAAKYGISARTVVNAALGQKNAMAAMASVATSYETRIGSLDTQLNTLKNTTSNYVTVSSGGHVVGRVMTEDALKQATALETQKKQLQESLAEYQKMPGVLSADAKAIQATAAATADYTGKLKGIPAAARTQILADGLEPTAQAIANLTKQYNLTPKQVKTLIAATGVDTSLHAVEVLTAAIHNIPTSHTTTIHTVYDTQHHGPTGNPQAQGGAGRSSAGYGATPLAYTLRGLGANPDGSPNGGDHVKLSHAAEQLLASIVPGIEKGKVKLSKALDAVSHLLDNRKQHYQDILSQYQSLAAGFGGFETSIFAVQGSTDDQGNQLPATLAQILAQGASNAAGATSLNSDVQKLIGEHLSQALIAQMESQGASGQANIHTLATQASLSDIAQLNQSEALTEQQLAAAGTAVANVLEGPEKTAAAAAVKQAETLDKILKAMQDGSQTVVVQINGQTLVSAIATHKKHHPDS